MATRLVWALGLLAGLAIASGTEAHPGGLNAEGCHNDRKSGGYHCHRAQTPSSLRSKPPAVQSGRQGAFKNCAEARAAGAAPVRRGDPGYGPHLDRDGDGKGCE